MAEAKAFESHTDALIVGAGPSGLMAAYWMARCGIKARIIDKCGTKVFTGHADGLRSRTLELFDSMGIQHRILHEGHIAVETNFWVPGKNGTLIRQSLHTPAKVNESPFHSTLLNQGRIECFILDSIRQHSNLEVERGIIAESLEYDENLEGDPNAYPITVQLRTLDDDEANLTGGPGNGDGSTTVHNGLDQGNLLPDDGDDLIQRRRSHQTKVEIVKAKYLIGCDGAHSWTRKQLNIPLEGSGTDHICYCTRGVMDIIPITNFHIRRIGTVTNLSGTMLVIPRERHLVRLYVPVHVVNTAAGGQFDRSTITLDMIRKRVQTILSPYSFEFQICDWWTAYRIAQRIAPTFSKGRRMFLAGDAVHTHSPKVGLGMNISMQDGFNIGWKVGLVAAGTAHPSILDTYSPERHRLAEMLLEFDRHWSKSFTDGKIPLAGTSEKMKSMVQVMELFEDFADGLKVFYGGSLLVWKNDGEDGPVVARCLIPGERFPPVKLRNQAEGRTEWTTRLLESDGRFHVVLLAGDVRIEAQRQRIERLSCFLAGQDSFLTHYASIPGRFHSPIRVVTIHSAPWREAEFFQFPDVLRPLDPVMGWDYSRIWCDDVCIWDQECDGQAYAKWAADRTRGAVIVVRPDQYIGWVGELEDVGALNRYFDGVLLKQ